MLVLFIAASDLNVVITCFDAKEGRNLIDTRQKCVLGAITKRASGASGASDVFPIIIEERAEARTKEREKMETKREKKKGEGGAICS